MFYLIEYFSIFYIITKMSDDELFDIASDSSNFKELNLEDKKDVDMKEPSAEEYINKFFELTNIYREWKKIGNIKDEDLTKKEKN